MDLAKELEIAKDVAQRAGQLIREAWNKPKNIDNKVGLDLVTDTDKACEQLILAALRTAFPGDQFIGEETSDADVQLGDGRTWMVDPVDGTTNFVHRIPFVAVSIGLAVARKPVLGVVYVPMLNELYWATEGGGAWLNAERINVSDCKSLQTAVVATGFPKYREYLDYQTAVCYELLTRKTMALRSFGSCAVDLCSVAQGRLDMMWESCCICCWDYCAGTVIVREAGGVVGDPLGGASLDLMAHRVVAAAAPELISAMVDVGNGRSLPAGIGKSPADIPIPK